MRAPVEIPTVSRLQTIATALHSTRLGACVWLMQDTMRPTPRTSSRLLRAVYALNPDVDSLGPAQHYYPTRSWLSPPALDPDLDPEPDLNSYPHPDPHPDAYLDPDPDADPDALLLPAFFTW